MEIKFTNKIKTTKNQKCSDCYYNGNCIINSKTCPYLKKENRNIDDK